ncbi:mitochondrial type II fatty acid synthase component [Fennellomyces sp. T-0311]|nr:mitochondrial type II fatty acid synthase component [Fennellomyces sp. T-0311]
MYLRPTVLFNAASRVAAATTAHQQALRATPAAFARLYTTGLTRENVETRVLDIVKGFDKVDSTKVSPTANFINDLGLDSLDAVEVVMAIEEEFGVEIPDKDADEIKSVGQAVDYIAKRDDAQ